MGLIRNQHVKSLYNLNSYHFNFNCELFKLANITWNYLLNSSSLIKIVIHYILEYKLKKIYIHLIIIP